MGNSTKRQTHLEYYKEHGISPVRYDMSSVDAHLQRRASLYNKLGLLPLAFRGARVLEVAAGTGHNSLYLAHLMPESLTLLEPNPTGLTHIQAAYAAFDRPHTKPVVVTQTLEEYRPAGEFDIVLCENWLGISEHETRLMEKLAGFVALNGVLVVTTVSPIGFVPNLLRRFMVPYLAPATLEFDRRTVLLEAAFGPHLKTLGAMTRSTTDWVHDNMMNPAYFGLCLSAPMLVGRLGDQFDVAGTYPVFAEDWRWFKGLYGENRRINEHFLEEYWRKCNNFLDNRQAVFAGDPVGNQRLEALSLELLAAIESHEDAHLMNPAEAATHSAKVTGLLSKFIEQLPAENLVASLALNEALSLILDPQSITIDKISVAAKFSGLFGRETSYLALERTAMGNSL